MTAMRTLLLALCVFAAVTALGAIAVWPQQDVAAQPLPPEAALPQSVVAPAAAPVWVDEPEPLSAPGEAAEVLDLEDSEDALLAGAVLDEEGRVPEEVSVAFVPAGDPESTTDASVNEDGSFEEFLPPGEYAVEGRAPGYLPVRMEGVVLGPGEEVRGLRLTLSRGLAVRGTVSAGQTPADDALVLLDGNGILLSAEVMEGAFEIDGLPPGTYRVRALHSQLGSDQRTVAAGGSVDLRLRLEERCGVVEDALGTAVAGALVELMVSLEGGDQPERDPAGDTGMGAPLPGGICGPDDCLGVAADEHGRFCLQVPPDAGLTVSTQGERGWALDSRAATDRRPLLLRVAPLRKLRLRLESLEDGDVFIKPLRQVPGAFLPGSSGDEGVVELEVPPGLDVALVHPTGTRLVPLQPLPGNVQLQERRPHHRHHCRHEIHLDLGL